MSMIDKNRLYDVIKDLEDSAQIIINAETEKDDKDYMLLYRMLGRLDVCAAIKKELRD